MDVTLHCICCVHYRRWIFHTDASTTRHFHVRRAKHCHRLLLLHLRLRLRLHLHLLLWLRLLRRRPHLRLLLLLLLLRHTLLSIVLVHVIQALELHPTAQHQLPRTPPHP